MAYNMFHAKMGLIGCSNDKVWNEIVVELQGGMGL
jgi:hypothetical protein